MIMVNYAILYDENGNEVPVANKKEYKSLLEQGFLTEPKPRKQTIKQKIFGTDEENREKLLKQAKALGIKVPHNIKEETLAEKIAEVSND